MALALDATPLASDAPGPIASARPHRPMALILANTLDEGGHDQPLFLEAEALTRFRRSAHLSDS